MCRNGIFYYLFLFQLLIYFIIFFCEKDLVQNCIEITKFYLLFASCNFSAISGKLNFSYPIFLCRANADQFSNIIWKLLIIYPIDDKICAAARFLLVKIK